MCNLLSKLVIVLLVLVQSAVYVQAAGSHGNQIGAPLIEQITAGTAFSFVYDGKPSQDLLPQWSQTSSSKSLGDGREIKVTTYRHQASGLEISREVTVFPEVPAVECILRLRNAGTRDTPIIEKILPLDLQFAAGEAGKIVLHYAHGSTGRAEDYLPIDQEVSPGAELRFAHYVLEGANHVDGQLPFFNLQWQGEGLIGAVGWTGQWAVRVIGESGRRVVVQAGQQTTHLKLHPGESIRTPRILLLHWKGEDRFLGHNKLRKLLLAHYVPRIDGQIVLP